jgi:hypothetical protein
MPQSDAEDAGSDPSPALTLHPLLLLLLPLAPLPSEAVLPPVPPLAGPVPSPPVPPLAVPAPLVVAVVVPPTEPLDDELDDELVDPPPLHALAQLVARQVLRAVAAGSVVHTGVASRQVTQLVSLAQAVASAQQEPLMQASQVAFMVVRPQLPEVEPPHWVLHSEAQALAPQTQVPTALSSLTAVVPAVVSHAVWHAAVEHPWMQVLRAAHLGSLEQVVV